MACISVADNKGQQAVRETLCMQQNLADAECCQPSQQSREGFHILKGTLRIDLEEMLIH